MAGLKTRGRSFQTNIFQIYVDYKLNTRSKHLHKQDERLFEFGQFKICLHKYINMF